MGGPSRREKTELLTLFPKSKQACRVFFKPFEIRLVKRKMVNFLKKIQMDLAEEKMLHL